MNGFGDNERITAPPYSLRDGERNTALHVMAIVEDEALASMMQRIVERQATGDRLSVCSDLAEALASAVAEAPEVVFIDVSIGRGGGLAVIHHLRAVAPDILIYALCDANTLQLGTQAVALGGTGLLMLPLAGDEFLGVLGQVRGRRAEREDRARLERVAMRQRKGESLVSRVAEISEAPTRKEAAERLAALLVEEARAVQVVVYLPAGEGSKQMMRVAVREAPEDAPYFSDELHLMTYARSSGLDVLRLAVRQEGHGLVLVGGAPEPLEGEDALPLVGLLTAQAATAFALIGAREDSSRGAMKDPSSSAYTFAYFVDVAGREIGRARRHGRRFSLVTLGLEGAVNADTEASSVEMVERVLTAIRATDILARVDVGELYLLLPETGGIGAHVARRRLLRALQAGRGSAASFVHLDAAIGVATYPHSGTDLSQLLRVAKHRTEASRQSVVRRLGLDRLSLADVLDALLWDAADASDNATGPEPPQVIELPSLDVVSLAAGALAEARRSGAVLVYASQRPGLSLAGALRSAMGRDAPEVQLTAIELGKSPQLRDLDVMALVGEHGCYALLGRAERGYVRAIHSADPSLVDVLIQRLADVAGARFGD
jgi:ActR/RegA family two-component response regulator/GGDEF domain-containing protein